MADRAQYFLEQSLAELLDLQEKKIFTPLEIKAITRKRTSFEQALSRKILRKADFLRYAEYEMNLEALRVQRVMRLQIKGKRTVSDWAGPRRIFFIFERATKRFHGDVDLWLQYIDYAKKQKATKVLGKVYSAALQFHPTNPSLWNLAAVHELEWNGNMTAARALMQRGLRLNSASKSLWLDYFKLELQYLSKIYNRWKILGIDQINEATEAELQEEEEDGEHIVLPKITHGEFEGDNQQSAILQDVNISTLTTMKDNAALQGAIPMAILKAGIKAMPQKPELLLDFYSIMARTEDLPFREEFLKDIVHHLEDDDRRNDSKACFLRIILPMTLLNDDVQNEEFPAAFRKSLSLYQQIAPQAISHLDLLREWTQYLTKLLVVPGIDQNLAKAISLTVEKEFKSEEKLSLDLYGKWIKFAKEHGKPGRADEIQTLAMEKTGIEHFNI